MSKGTCQKPGCTVAESGICLLSNVPLEKCANFRPSASVPTAATDKASTNSAAAEPAATPDSGIVSGGRRFHTGLELGSEDALVVSRATYCHVIGILGDSGAGKTCFLLSLYLMACRAELPKDYAFAGSLTLKGFEERARHLRQWKGGSLPAKLADHTTLSDTREAALLHFALQRNSGDKRRIDLLFTDLPGEWSKNLIDSKSTAQRFEFLKRADGIILVVDGPVLASSAKHVELTRLKHLLERLKTDVGIDISIPIAILISKGDKISMKVPDAMKELLQFAQGLGFSLKVVVASAFSYDAAFKSGLGVFDAIEPLFTSPPLLRTEPIEPDARSSRRFSAFGRKNS